MQNLYGVEPGEVYWAASDVGWVVGHTYIVYAPLLHGCTTILYEGKPVGTPDAGAFWRVIAEHGVRRHVHRADRLPRHQEGGPARASSSRKYDLSSSARCSSPASAPIPTPSSGPKRHARRCRSSTTGGRPRPAGRSAAIRSGLGALPVKYGSPTVPMPGYDAARARRRAASRCRASTIGTIAIKLPLPPSCLPTLWNNDERFRDSYLAEFPGYYKTADAGFMDDDGYVYVMARTDDVINVAGHRLSTGGMEEVLAAHQDVAECAVIGVADEMKGQVPCGFIVLKAGVNRAAGRDRARGASSCVREEIGPVAAFKLAMTVGAPAEDALGQDPARHHAADRRRRALEDAGDDRRSGHPRRDHGGAEGEGRRARGLSRLGASARAPSSRKPRHAAIRDPWRRRVGVDPGSSLRFGRDDSA